MRLHAFLKKNKKISPNLFSPQPLLFCELKPHAKFQKENLWRWRDGKPRKKNLNELEEMQPMQELEDKLRRVEEKIEERKRKEEQREESERTKESDKSRRLKKKKQLEESWEMLNWMVQYMEENEEIWKKEGDHLLEIERNQTEENLIKKSENSTIYVPLTTPQNQKSTEDERNTTPLSLSTPNPTPPKKM